MSETALASGRFAAESRMTSRVTIRRIDADNPRTTGGNGFEVDNYLDVATDVPFRLGGAPDAGAYRRITIGESEVQVAVRVGSLPASQSDLQDNDLLDVAEGESAGLVLQVVEATWQDQATARRVPVVEVQRPEGWT